MIFRSLDGGRIVLSERAHVKLLGHRQLEEVMPEAGGVLLGWHCAASQDRTIDDITEPQPEDRRERSSFFRSAAHQTLALARWHETGETHGHLGLWHSHPELHPTPSAIDLRDWRQALATDQFEGHSLLFVIVGQASVRVWEGRRKQKREIVELHSWKESDR